MKFINGYLIAVDAISAVEPEKGIEIEGAELEEVKQALSGTRERD